MLFMPWQDLTRIVKSVLTMIRTSLKSLDDFYSKGLTKNPSYRIFLLKSLKKTLKAREEELLAALYLDLNKPRQEAFLTELLLVYKEIDLMVKKLEGWQKKSYRTGILQQPARAYSVFEPRGRVLILSPWNYPVHLSLLPLVGALAAGNVVMLRPSSTTPETSRVLKEVLEDWNSRVVQVVLGDVYDELLEEAWDLVFFTGSPSVGRIVASKAGKTLSPTILELGGKSPALVLDGDMKKVAERILIGKLLNCGQTCIAPDYVLVTRDNKTRLVEELISAYEAMGDSGVRIVSERHFDRLEAYLEDEEIIYESLRDRTTGAFGLYLVEPRSDSRVMEEEIFGPILPIVEMEFDEMLAYVKAGHKPLALYGFTEDDRVWKKVLKELSFGGGVRGGTIFHLVGEMPFGGVGDSGYGSYHGRRSFEAFSHEKAILDKKWGYTNPMKEIPFLDKISKLL